MPTPAMARCPAAPELHDDARPRRRAPLALLLALLLPAAACTLVPEPPAVVTDAPTLLYPPARELQGAGLDALLVHGEPPATPTPLERDTLRRVATGSREAVLSLFVRTRVPHKVRMLPFLKVDVLGEGLGSGFLIHPSGYALTNDHVVADAEQVMALTWDGVAHEVVLVARDPVYDLALVKLTASSPFPVLPMGDSDPLDVGDMVVAVGNPLGLGHTVTFGIISQTGRNLTGLAERKIRSVSYLQTDCAINPGSSGGPLIDLEGQWIGVNTAGITEAQNIGFTVPSRYVLDFLQEVLAGEGRWQPARR